MPMDTTQRILKLYECSAPNNELHKDKWLSNEKVISPYVPKDNNSISNPHIIIHTFEGLIAYNYCYIDDYQRYYFIEDMILLPQGQVELVCKVDVLYSFKNSIGELVVHETRATNGTSNFLPDTEVATQINAKPYVIPMTFKNGKGFYGQDWRQLEYVVRWFTKVQFTADPVTGNATNGLSAGCRSDIADKPSDPTLTNLQAQIGENIARLALLYHDGYMRYLQGNPLGATDEQKKYIYPCGYTNNQDWEHYKDGVLVTSPKSLLVDNYGIGATFDALLGTNFDYVPISRYDDKLAEHSTISYNSGTRLTGLNIVNSSAIETWNNNHPSSNQINTDYPGWNGWDCSSFAWRVCLFNSDDYPVDINNNTVGSGKYATTGSELAFLSNHGCLVHQVASKADLIAGDLIFSGHDDSSDHYWVGIKNGVWECRDKVDETYIDPTTGETKTRKVPPDVSDLSDVISVNHVRVYIGDVNDDADKNGDYVDTTSNKASFSVKDGLNKPKGDLNRGSVGTISIGEDDSTFTNVTDTREGSGNVHIRVCRPSLLWGHQE